MNVFFGLRHIQRPFRRPIVTLGAFDGIHLAHRFILHRIIQKARRVKGTSLLVTFDPHPLKILRPDRPFSSLTCIEHRLKILSELGLDTCVVLRFTKQFSRLSAKAFIEEILVGKLGISELWVGFNYAFGRDREGNIQLLKEYGKRYGFRVRQIPEVKMGKKRFSSTKIRTLIARGDLTTASHFLGRPYSLYGKVVKGSGRGKWLGYPTANLKPYHEAIPPKGVYGVKVFLPHKRKGYTGILNIGHRPTFEKRSPLTLEVHLLDFRGDLYGRKIEVAFLKKIRSERLFSTKEALLQRIRCDEDIARKMATVPVPSAVLPGRRGLPW
ncbi:MAG: bifunctional riboflavin kinase/FAD synthetase [Candidatus Omnitrophica bacterium]|nr:bifunctional riboflavin kinase/FAD synthetase [Candidatus Omnitrophota bacterium]